MVRRDKGRVAGTLNSMWWSDASNDVLSAATAQDREFDSSAGARASRTTGARCCSSTAGDQRVVLDHADPRLRALLAAHHARELRRELGVAGLPADTVPPPGSIDAAVWAKGLTMADVIEAIAATIGASASAPDELIDAVLACEQRLVAGTATFSTSCCSAFTGESKTAFCCLFPVVLTPGGPRFSAVVVRAQRPADSVSSGWSPNMASAVSASWAASRHASSAS